MLTGIYHNDGMTPLHLAAKNGHLEHLGLLWVLLSLFIGPVYLHLKTEKVDFKKSHHEKKIACFFNPLIK